MVGPRGLSLVCAIAVLYVLALAALVGRVYTKRRRWGVDDFVYAVAFIFAAVHAALILSCVELGGYGNVPTQQWERIEVRHYIAALFYVLSSALSRIAAALFLAVLARTSPPRWPARAVAGLSATWGAASVLCIAFGEGRPWEGSVTEPLFYKWLGVEAVGILLEVSLFVLSTSLIGRSRGATQKRSLFVAGFATRLIVIPLIATRLLFLYPSHAQPTWTVLPTAILTESVLALSLITAYTPFLPSLLAVFYPLYSIAGLPLAATTTLTLSKKRYSDRYHRLHTLRRGSSATKSHESIRTNSKKKEKRTNTWKSKWGGKRNNEAHGEPDWLWKPYVGFSEGSAAAYPAKVHVSSGSWGRKSRGHGGEEEGMEGMGPMTIQRTTEFSVDYGRRAS